MIRWLEQAGWRACAVAAALLARGETAIAYRRRMAEARPDDAAALASLAHLCAQHGRRDEAIALLERAVVIEPARGVAWFNLGYLRQETAKHDEAIDAFDRALALDDRLDLACYGKALSLIRSGRLQDAVAPLLRTIELQPMSPYGYYQLAHLYHRLGRHEAAGTIVRRLAGFEPEVAHRLERETGFVTEAGAPG